MMPMAAVAVAATQPDQVALDVTVIVTAGATLGGRHQPQVLRQLLWLLQLAPVRMPAVGRQLSRLTRLQPRSRSPIVPAPRVAMALIPTDYDSNPQARLILVITSRPHSHQRRPEQWPHRVLNTAAVAVATASWPPRHMRLGPQLHLRQVCELAASPATATEPASSLLPGRTHEGYDMPGWLVPQVWPHPMWPPPRRPQCQLWAALRPQARHQLETVLPRARPGHQTVLARGRTRARPEPRPA